MITCLLILGYAGIGNALLTNSDYNLANDGLLVLDTDTGLEWALVTQTGNSVDYFFNSSIYSGGGFSVATASDLLTFFTNAGAPGLTIGAYHSGDVYDAPAQLIYQLMDFTIPYIEFSGNNYIHAWYDNGNGSYDTGRVGYDGDTYIGQSNFTIGNNNYSNQPSSFSHGAYSVWAYREGSPVPEPATMLLLGAGLIGLAGTRRKIKT